LALTLTAGSVASVFVLSAAWADDDTRAGTNADTQAGISAGQYAGKPAAQRGCGKRRNGATRGMPRASRRTQRDRLRRAKLNMNVSLMH
jgi:hypothetical protein